MKAYVMTTGVAFALLTVAHIWRATVERHLASEPWFMLITIATSALCVWAGLLLRRAQRT